MRNLTTILTIVIITLFIPFIYNIMIKKAKACDENTLNFEINIKWLAKIFVVLLLIDASLMVIVNIVEDLPFYVNVIFIATLLIFALVLYVCRYNIKVNGSEITYTPCFGKSMKLSMSDITHIVIRKLNYGIIGYDIFVGTKKVFSLTNMLKNVESFINIAKSNNIKFIEK